MSEFIWRRAGAWSGGTVNSVALSSASTKKPIALAATDAGVFRSADSGHTWARGRDLAYTAAHVVVLASHDVGSAFAATRDGGLFQSHDAGASWQRLAEWSFGRINALALSPNFGADATLFAATPDGIYRSLDGGRGWQSASFGLLDSDVLCLTCAPDFASSEVVWAGSAAGGVYRSRNAGRAWRESGVGLADSAIQCMVYAGSTLFAGTEGAGVFRWVAGGQWETGGLEGRVINGLVVSAGTLLAGTDAGVFRLEEDGRTWHCTLTDDSVLALAAAPNGGVIAGGMVMGASLSADGGRTWQRTAGLAAHVPPLAACAPDGTPIMFDMAGNAACSPDAGHTWKEITLSDGPIVCVATGGAAQQSVMWVATERRVLHLHAQTGAFEPLVHQPDLSDKDAICALTVTQDGLILLGTRAGKVAISLDNGVQWHTLFMPSALPVSAIDLTPGGGLFGLCLVPSDNSATFNAEVWHLPTLVLPMAQPSADWRIVVALDSLHTQLACMTIVNAADGERVVLAGQNRIVVASPTTNHAHMATLPDGTAITALISAHGDLFASTNRGVFSSGEVGEIWQQCVGDFGDVPVVALLANAQGLVAITLGGDHWQGIQTSMATAPKQRE